MGASICATSVPSRLPSPPVLRGRGAGGEEAEPAEDVTPLKNARSSENTTASPGATCPLTPALSPGVPGERGEDTARDWAPAASLAGADFLGATGGSASSSIWLQRACAALAS